MRSCVKKINKLEVNAVSLTIICEIDVIPQYEGVHKEIVCVNSIILGKLSGENSQKSLTAECSSYLGRSRQRGPVECTAIETNAYKGDEPLKGKTLRR